MDINKLRVIPLMFKHNISEEEAILRLNLLDESGILKTGKHNQVETQNLIDGFLAQDSEVLAQTVLLERTFTACIENKDFVANFDRLTKSNMGRVLKQMQSGQDPPDAKKHFKKFKKFVSDTVLAKAIKDGESNSSDSKSTNK